MAGRGWGIGSLLVAIGFVAAGCTGASTSTTSPSSDGTPTTSVVSESESGARGSAPAGAHECASATRGEIDRFFGSAVPEGVYNSPMITVAVCVWHHDESTLVLTLFPDPGSARALAADHGDPVLVPDLGTEAWWAPGADASRLIVDIGSTILQLEWSADESETAKERLIALASQMIPRIPGAMSG